MSEKSNLTENVHNLIKKYRPRSSVYQHFLSLENLIDYYQSNEQIEYRNAYAIKKRRFFLKNQCSQVFFDIFRLRL